MDREIIEGNRIILRPITHDDTEAVLRWRNADRTVSNFYYRVPISAEEHGRWLDEKVATGTVWQYIVILKETDEPIGCVYLQHIDPATMTGETGVFFSEDAPAGKGLATEAVKLLGEEVGFKKLGLLHLTAKVIDTNAASLKLHQNAGYRIAKTVAGEKCSDGSTVGSVYFVKDARAYRFDRKPLIAAKTGRIGELEDGSLEITVPGSKSITNRALLVAMLAEGKSVLGGTLFSDDTKSFLGCMDALGIRTEVDRERATVTVYGCSGRIPVTEGFLNVGSAGTAARFLTAVLGLTGGGIYHMDSSDQMKKRPMAPLLDTLREMGCEVIYEGEEGFFPFTLKPHGFRDDHLTVDIDKSSQFLSAMLIAAPLSGKDVTIGIKGSHGLSYVEMTRKILASFGIDSEKTDSGYIVKAGAYKAADYSIEPDASAAAYFYAMSPLIGRSVTVNGLHESSMQGDTLFVKVLESLGLEKTEDTTAGIRAVPCTSKPGGQEEVTIDMSGCSDQTITLAAVAPFTGKSIRITGISHIRLQESDRISAIVNNLKKLGISCTEENDDIVITPSGSAQGAVIDTYNDHRMAMGFSLAGLKIPGTVIDDPMCCSKTFPDYFAYLDEIRAKMLE